MFARYGFLACLMVVALASPVLAQQDKIYRKNGQQVSGTVTGMSKMQVVVGTSGGDDKIPANEIARISYESEPSAMSDVRTNIAQANYKAAYDELKTIDLNKIDRDVVRQEIEYLKAFSMAKIAMSEGGDKAAAETALKDFAAKYKDSYRFFSVAELAGDVAASAGKYPDAVKYYGALEKVSWSETKLRAMVELARVNWLQKNYPDALAKYDAVLADPAKTAETEPLMQLARIGRAACLAETGKSAEAIKLLAGPEGVISKTDPKNAAIMARAYNALGVAHLRAGDKKAALLAFLHTDLLFFTQSDAHAEALHHLVRLWVDMKKNDQSVLAQNTLRQRYAGSVWAN